VLFCFLFAAFYLIMSVTLLSSILFILYSVHTLTGVNTAGDAGDTSPPIFWLVGTSMGISPPIFLRTFGYSRQFIPYISRSMFDKADFLRP